MKLMFGNKQRVENGVSLILFLFQQSVFRDTLSSYIQAKVVFRCKDFEQQYHLIELVFEQLGRYNPPNILLHQNLKILAKIIVMSIIMIICYLYIDPPGAGTSRGGHVFGWWSGKNAKPLASTDCLCHHFLFIIVISMNLICGLASTDCLCHHFLFIIVISMNFVCGRGKMH